MAQTLKEIVSNRLAELDRNPFEAARIGKLERSYVNDILIDRKLSVRPDKMDGLAAALDWSVAELFPQLHAATSREKKRNAATVMGRIGAGAEITPEHDQVPPDGLFQIESAVPLPNGAIAFEVEGLSMWPRYDPKDVVICLADGVPISSLVLGEEAAVRTASGQRFLKRVVAGRRKGLFNLVSHNAPDILDVRLEWASDIWTVIRASKWKRLSISENVRKTLPKTIKSRMR